MRSELPYFMQNPDWYYTIDGEIGYYLTESAPPEAIKSYNEFYSNDLEEDEDGEIWLIRR